LIASVLGRRYRTLSSRASYNNDIGVPLSLLELGRHHEAAVVEVGTNHPGELAPLVGMVQPTLGVLTSLGREHLEHFESLDAVAEEEGALADGLRPEGTLLVNGDTPLVDRVITRSRGSVLRVGLRDGNDWRGEVRALEADGVVFWVSEPEGAWSGEYRVPLLGRHQVTNAMLAIAVGARLGLDREAIAEGLARCPLPRRRLELRQVDGLWVLDDAYNANPDSVIAALETLRALPCAGRRIVVLGDMAEVGERAEELHAEVGRHAAGLGLDALCAVGPLAAQAGHAARKAGMEGVELFADAEGAVGALLGRVGDGDVVLVKASRSTQLERVSDALCHRAAVR
jgi:UDP-N-acetylmuramoyl-tripeptide--D-alanyl-D-alanine ligase